MTEVVIRLTQLCTSLTLEDFVHNPSTLLLKNWYDKLAVELNGTLFTDTLCQYGQSLSCVTFSCNG